MSSIRQTFSKGHVLKKYAAVRQSSSGRMNNKMKEINRIHTPYRGDSPYIFISYSHKDSDVVFDIIGQLQMKQYRIWYDEGIDPGTE